MAEPTSPHATRQGAELCRCGHERQEHGQERQFYECDDSKRAVCLACPGYEVPGYPTGNAWHRFRAVLAAGGTP